MNTELFARAKTAYGQGLYTEALQALTQCLQDPANPLKPGEAGLLYHQIGNCLVKLGNHMEAIQAYTQATADSSYGACGAVNYNLGMAYAALGDYEDAVSHFEIAVSDGKYDTPYKAYLAMGNAQMKLGKSAEAGIAFRAAALDEHNPNPARALLNLGVCFMALNRPADAVVSYESALQFDMEPAVKNKLYANLGQAYVAVGQMQNACHAFEQALADKTYHLSASASVDYQRAVGAMAQGTAEIPIQASDGGRAPVAALAEDNAMSGLDVMATETPDSYAPYSRGYDGNAQAGFVQDSARPSRAASRQQQAYGQQVQPVDQAFFEDRSKGDEQWNMLSNAAPKKRRLGLKIAIVVVVILIVLLGVGMYFYAQGWGYPSQETVVSELFADPEAAETSLFADGINEATAEQLASRVVKDKDVTIDGVNKSMSTSTVYATTTLVDGGNVTYQISLVRDMLTWKVADVQIYHQSLQGTTSTSGTAGTQTSGTTTTTPAAEDTATTETAADEATAGDDTSAEGDNAEASGTENEEQAA